MQQFLIPNPQQQRGAAFLVSMVMLIVLTILVLTSMRNAGLNARMAGNSQILNTFKNTVDGEGFAQAGFFASKAQASAADAYINAAIINTEKFNQGQSCTDTAGNAITCGAPVSAITSGAEYVQEVKINLIDMSNKLKAALGPFEANDFIHGSMCQGYGQGVQCANMVVDIDASNAQPVTGVTLDLASRQVLGFGVIAPKRQGAVAINTAAP